MGQTRSHPVVQASAATLLVIVSALVAGCQTRAPDVWRSCRIDHERAMATPLSLDAPLPTSDSLDPVENPVIWRVLEVPGDGWLIAEVHLDDPRDAALVNLWAPPDPPLACYKAPGTHWIGVVQRAGRQRAYLMLWLLQGAGDVLFGVRFQPDVPPGGPAAHWSEGCFPQP